MPCNLERGDMKDRENKARKSYWKEKKLADKTLTAPKRQDDNK